MNRQDAEDAKEDARRDGRNSAHSVLQAAPALQSPSPRPHVPTSLYLPTMTYHERFMHAALEHAVRAGEIGEVPVGAVVVRDGAVIASAHNETVATGDPTAHAEMLAIRRAVDVTGDARLVDCSLYVTLEPCAMCAGAIVLARLQQVVFGAFDEKAGATGTLYSITNDRRLNHRAETHGGVLDAECAELLRSFFDTRRDAAERHLPACRRQ